MKPTPIKYKINTERTQYAKILLLLHNIPKYYYYDTIF